MFSVKGQRGNIWGIAGHIVCHNYSTLWPWLESSRKQYTSACAPLRSTKIVFGTQIKYCSLAFCQLFKSVKKKSVKIILSSWAMQQRGV